MTGPRLQLRSYRLAFELERRIFRIDRFRIPVPYGLALSTVGWWFAALLLVVMTARAPVVGVVVGVVPWPVRLIVLPAALARALCAPGPDGRPAYQRALARGRRAAGPRRVVAFVRAAGPRVERLGDVAVAGDERSSTLRRAVIRGPGPVLVARPARGVVRHSRIELIGRDDRWLDEPKRLELEAGGRLEVSCDPR